MIALVASKYEQILNYVVSVDVIFFGLTAVCVFVFRKRGGNPTVREGVDLQRASSAGTLPDRPTPAGLPGWGPRGRVSATFRIPGHPFTTLFFIAACCVITFSLLYKFPLNSGISFGIMLLGVPAYFIWARGDRR